MLFAELKVCVFVGGARAAGLIDGREEGHDGHEREREREREKERARERERETDMGQRLEREREEEREFIKGRCTGVSAKWTARARTRSDGGVFVGGVGRA